jgi:hypothetical protein
MADKTKRLGNRYIYLGTDPEFFFQKGGKIIGAEKVMPARGIPYEPGSCHKRDGDYTSKSGSKSRFIIDGVQAEMNPRPNTCRANLANEISACFNKLHQELNNNGEIEVDFSGVIEVSDEEFDSLSEKSKRFGCDPDFNIYKKKMNKVKVDPKVYRKRSAGGHIHLGCDDYSVNIGGSRKTEELGKFSLHEIQHGKEISEEVRKKLGLKEGKYIVKLDGIARALQKPERVLPILDILVGNTCVLIDRDKNASERRKVYGRAGDYRLPPHGIEYRTLSNFWLRSYPMMSFVFGMARMAVMVVAENIEYGSVWECKLKEAVNWKDIEKAINKNDFDLAMSNFNKIVPIIEDMVNGGSNHFPLAKGRIEPFRYFVEKGLDYWFKEDILQHWVKLLEGHGHGWETYCDRTVKPKMQRKEVKV